MFLRDYTQIINKHPTSWNTPCLLPRDADCGKYLDTKSIYRVDPTLKVIEWKIDGINHWTHFDEIYITKPTTLLGKRYIGNVKEI